MDRTFINLDTALLRLFRDAQHEFHERYPFLKIALAGKSVDKGADNEPSEENRRKAANLLYDQIGLSDDMTVANLEKSLLEWFGTAVQVLRRNGDSWMETSRTREWTLGLQNEQGRYISQGFPIT